MTVQELIDELQKIEDKTLEVGHKVYFDGNSDYESIDGIEIFKGQLLFTNTKQFVNLK
jgi:hypothetical protein